MDIKKPKKYRLHHNKFETELGKLYYYSQHPIADEKRYSMMMDKFVSGLYNIVDETLNTLYNYDYLTTTSYELRGELVSFVWMKLDEYNNTNITVDNYIKNVANSYLHSRCRGKKLEY